MGGSIQSNSCHAATYIKDCFGLSDRRASRLVDLGRNTLRYQRKPDKDEALRTRMKELAAKHNGMVVAGFISTSNVKAW